MMPWALMGAEITPKEALEALEKVQGKQEITQMLPYWRTMVEGGKWAELGGVRDSSLMNVPEVKTFLEAVRREQQKKAKEDRARIEALLKEAGVAVEKAKTPEDLDEIIKKLTESKGGREYGYGSGEELQGLYQNLQSTRQIVAEWQDYLMEIQTGQSEKALSSLQSISQYLANYPLIPRSKVLRMMSGEGGNQSNEPKVDPSTQIEAIMVQFEKDRNAEVAWASLQKIPEQQRRNYGAETMQQLQAFRRFQQNAPLMSPEEVVRALQQNNRNTSLWMSFNNEANVVIAKSLQIAVPKERVSTDQYLRSHADEAIGRDDWTKAQRILTLLDILASGSGSPSGDLTAISSYLKGIEFEKAGIWNSAVTSYRTAMHSKVRSFPLEKITVRLEALKQQDAGRFEKALEGVSEQEQMDRAKGLALMHQQLSRPGQPTFDVSKLEGQITEIVRREIRAMAAEKQKSEAVEKSEKEKK